jgi:predicted esterase
MVPLLFAVVFPLAAGVAQAPLAIELTQKDKPPIAALWTPPALALDTEFGSATVKPDRVEQIVFGDPDVVVAAGVELRGKLKLTGIEAKIDGKARRFTLKEIESLVVVRDGGGAAAAKGTFTGEWMTTFGPAKLQQRGLTVTGTYGHDGKGEIEGKLERNTLQLQWRNGGRSGKGSVELLPKDGAFGGKLDGDEFWGGYRKAPQRAASKPGEVASGQTEAGLRYHVRLPKAAGADKKWPAICILHGSNMDSRAYVDTIVAAWPELAEQHIVVGLDGENLSPGAKAGALCFNYSYINFSGPGVGPAWVHRQSPALVADALEQLQKELPISKWFLGGHSQGGFLTYCLVMYYPQLLAGAFPMSCNLLVQCEPDVFDAAKMQAQHRVAVAVIHGRADDVVEFSSGAYCHLRMIDGGFPWVRLFAPERIGHQFALLPVDQAVRWLAACSAADPEVLLRAGEAGAAEQRWRDVGAVLKQLGEASPPAALRERTDALAKKLEAALRPRTAELEKAIGKGKDGRWIDDFLTWRAEFGTAASAEKVLADYAELRAAQKKDGDALFGEWRGARDAAARKAIFDKVAKTCYATKWYESMRAWMQ